MHENNREAGCLLFGACQKFPAPAGVLLGQNRFLRTGRADTEQDAFVCR